VVARSFDHDLGLLDLTGVDGLCINP